MSRLEGFWRSRVVHTEAIALFLEIPVSIPIAWLPKSPDPRNPEPWSAWFRAMKIAEDINVVVGFVSAGEALTALR